MAKIPVGGELTSIATDHKLVDAAQVKDESRENKTQKEINDSLYQGVNEAKEGIDGVQEAAEDAKEKAQTAKRGLFQQTFIDPYLNREESEEEKKRKRNRRMIAALGDGLTALANFAGAVHGATPLQQKQTLTGALGAKDDKERKERLEQAKLAQQRLLKLEEEARKAEAASASAEKEHNRNILNAMGIKSNKAKQEKAEEFRQQELDQKITYQNASLDLRKKVFEEMQRKNSAYIANLGKKKSGSGGSKKSSGGWTAKQRADYDNAIWYGKMSAEHPERMSVVMGDRVDWRTGKVNHPKNSNDYATIRAKYNATYGSKKKHVIR